MMNFTPTHVRFIKLGRNGKWEKECIEDGTLRLGYESNQHAESLRGDWESVRKFWVAKRKDSGAATRDVRQIRDFYELPKTTLWITFYNRLLYWCFADDKVSELECGSRIRRAFDGWSCKSLSGSLLHIENIDGRITKVQGFRGTICSVELPEYIERKVRGIEQPEIVTTRAALETLRNSIAQLIKGLWWHDFELLVDLIFVRSGWQRIAVVGKTEKDVDLDLLSPVTNKRAYVQVKSQANLLTIKEAIKKFENNQIYDQFYFVAHTVDRKVTDFKHERTTIIDLEKLAELTINAGLVNWVLKKSS